MSEELYPGGHARTQPGKAAAIDADTGEVLTYQELDKRSNQLAWYLYDEGFRPGDHVAAMMENSLAYVEVLWACLRSGLYLTPINRFLSAAEAAYIIDDCDARAIIVSAGLEQAAQVGVLSARCSIRLSVGGSVEGFEEYGAAVAGCSEHRLDEERAGAFMFYSSGTTGKPKGILRPLPSTGVGQTTPLMRQRADLFGFGADTIFLSTAPLYHAAPLGYAQAITQVGGTLVIMRKFDAETALRLVEQYRVTHSSWVPTMFIRLLKLPEDVRQRYDLSSMACAIHAAAPCPVAVKQAMIDWWGPIIHEYYSSTESAGLATITSAEWLAHPGSVGRAKGLPFHICDEDGAELPPGVPGLIYGQALPGPPFRYHKDPAKSESVRHPRNPDWVSVGDIGYLDDEGYLYLTDRKAFMIVSGGVNIYPQQIEDALALHPKVADIAVIGVPNPDLGEEVKAIVELAAGIEPGADVEREIIAFVAEKLGRQLAPRSVDFTDALPRLPTGKLYKQGLREKYWGSGYGRSALSTLG